MRKSLLFVLCGFLSGAVLSANASLAIVYGEQSVPSAERGYNKAMARNLGRWLDDAGMPAATYPDSEIKKALRPSGTTVAHLVSLVNPSEDMLREIDAFLARSGKLIVYNSPSPELARRLGLQAGAYQRAPTFHAWAQFRFAQNAPSHLPEVVPQSSAALHEFKALDSSATVIAWWEDRAGRRSDYPAWFAHKNGFWMSHVLLADADGQSRRRLLAALSGACDSGLWRFSAETLYKRIGDSFGARNFEAAVKRIGSSAPPALKGAVESVLTEAGAAHATILRDRKNKDFASATLKLWHLEQILTEAVAVQQERWPGSVRAVWDHEGFGLFVGDWERTCATLRMHGITDLFLLVATPTSTHADVPGLSPTRLRRDFGDQLAAATAAARRHGIRVHAWVSALKPMLATREELEKLRSGGVLLGEPGGEANPWMDPANLEARKRLELTISHLIRRYAVAGIHLDYIRYPDLRSGLDAKSRQAFERKIKRKVEKWPEDILNANHPMHKQYTAYRAGLVSELVAGAKNTMLKEKSGLTLSAAVYGRYPLCADSVGQDWMSWLHKDTLDWAVPMNYTADMAAYSRLLTDQARNRDLRGRILSGIGVTAAECTLNALQVMEQIRLTRRAGMGGYAFFDLDLMLQREVLPFLSLGAQRAE